MRITIKHVEAKVAIVNKLLGFDDPQYPTPGQIVLYRAYGATGIHRVVNTAGGQSNLMGLGTMREASEFLSGMIAALRISQETTV